MRKILFVRALGKERAVKMFLGRESSTGGEYE